MAKILLVENDPLLAFLRKSTLEQRFPDVERVGDAAEALCLVEQPQFAENLGLVVSGLDMPGTGGPEFVAELHQRLPHVPVLVLGSNRIVARDYDGGWAHFLPGPIFAENLLAQAGQMLKQRELALA